MSTTTGTGANPRGYRTRRCTNGPHRSSARSGCCVVSVISSTRTASPADISRYSLTIGRATCADLCHQHGVDMLGRAHSTAYIQQQLSFLRVYANAWVGKHGTAHPL